MSKPVMHYAENDGYFWPYCGANSSAYASPKMNLTTCKKCLAKIARDGKIK